MILIASLLLATAVFGYFQTGDVQKIPVRILMKNNGGKVLFAHSAHIQNTGVQCAECHHEKRRDIGTAMDSAMACESCHPKELNEDFLKGHQELNPDKSSCVGCHHLKINDTIFNHEEHEDYASDCTDCHHDPSVEPEPQNCVNCHQETEVDGVPGVRLAVHERCADCHQDMFESELAGCTGCHVFTKSAPGNGDSIPCGQCHEAGGREPIPPRMQAFHQGCMSCHEKMDTGPFGEGVCNQCHINK